MSKNRGWTVQCAPLCLLKQTEMQINNHYCFTTVEALSNHIGF